MFRFLIALFVVSSLNSHAEIYLDLEYAKTRTGKLVLVTDLDDVAAEHVLELEDLVPGQTYLKIENAELVFITAHLKDGEITNGDLENGDQVGLESLGIEDEEDDKIKVKTLRQILLRALNKKIDKKKNEKKKVLPAKKTQAKRPSSSSSNYSRRSSSRSYSSHNHSGLGGTTTSGFADPKKGHNVKLRPTRNGRTSGPGYTTITRNKDGYQSSYTDLQGRTGHSCTVTCPDGSRASSFSMASMSACRSQAYAKCR